MRVNAQSETVSIDGRLKIHNDCAIGGNISMMHEGIMPIDCRYMHDTSTPIKSRSATVVAVSICAVFLIGWARHVTGPEYSFSLFFLFPITLCAWCAGRPAGFCVALLSAFTWLAADVEMLDRFSHPLVPFVNETCRLGIFLFATEVIVRFKNVLDQQRMLARIDPLTGMANRLAFFESAELELKRARRLDYPVSLLFMDVDNFKTVNDRDGHAAGDRILCIISETILKNIRAIDIAARFGGDEFAVLFSDTGDTQALGVAEKLRHILNKEITRHQWPVTFSIGVATCNIDNPGCIHEMINKADTLMYWAKQTGKNKTYQQTTGVKSGP